MQPVRVKSTVHYCTTKEIQYCRSLKTSSASLIDTDFDLKFLLCTPTVPRTFSYLNPIIRTTSSQSSEIGYSGNSSIEENRSVFFHFSRLLTWIQPSRHPQLYGLTKIRYIFLKKSAYHIFSLLEHIYTQSYLFRLWLLSRPP